jgi:hypothetical protein
MAKIKTYRSKLYSRYSIRILVDGKLQTVEFEGGFKQGTMMNGGHFSTTDQKLQKAIEETKQFLNGDITITFEEEFADSNKPEAKPVKKPAPVKVLAEETQNVPIKPREPIAQMEQEKEEVSTADEYTIVETVKTRQEARMYFRDVHGATGMTPTLSDKLLSELCQKYKIKFTNLK